MKILFIKLFTAILFFSFGFNSISAQQVGKPSPAFFNTNAQGGQLGHLQGGAFGTFTNTARWIGIGQPNVPSGTELYGMRIQDRDYVGTMSLNGNSQVKDMEIQWGRIPVFSTGPVPSIPYTPTLNFKFLNSAVNSQLAMRLSNNGYLETFGQVRSYAGINNFAEFTEIAHGGSNGYINTQGDGNLEFRHDNNTKMQVGSNGALAINSNYNGTFYKLYVAGRAFSTGGWLTPSDARYKKDITAIVNASEKLAQLEGVTYGFKKEVINDIDFAQQNKEQQIGFIAQELDKVFPELVVQDDRGYYAVNYQGLIPVLVEGFNEQGELITEQSKLITEQESTIEAMNQELQNMKQQMAELINVVNQLNDDASLNITPASKPAIGKLLEQNRPNPFNGLTIIDYKLPVDASNAKLIIYNIDGKQMRSFPLTDRQGSVNFDASNLSPGTYFYALQVNGEQLAQEKMVVQ